MEAAESGQICEPVLLTDDLAFVPDQAGDPQFRVWSLRGAGEPFVTLACHFLESFGVTKHSVHIGLAKKFYTSNAGEDSGLAMQKPEVVHDASKVVVYFGDFKIWIERQSDARDGKRRYELVFWDERRNANQPIWARITVKEE